MAVVDPAGVVEGAASRGDPVVRRVLELFHLTLQMALPALGFLVAVAIPGFVYRNRRGLRA